MLRCITWNVNKSLASLTDSHAHALCEYDVVVLTEIAVRSEEESLGRDDVYFHKGIGPRLRERFTWYVQPRPVLVNGHEQHQGVQQSASQGS